ncbi:MAG: BrnT family toxin [Candidatus Solibacter sp.]
MCFGSAQVGVTEFGGRRRWALGSLGMVRGRQSSFDRVYTCTQLMDFEWDVQKAHLNARKHGIQFADAVHVLEDDQALTTSEHAANGEERWASTPLHASWFLSIRGGRTV